MAQFNYPLRMEDIAIYPGLTVFYKGTMYNGRIPNFVYARHRRDFYGWKAKGPVRWKNWALAERLRRKTRNDFA